MQSSKLMTSLNFSNSKDKDKNNINICVANPIHTVPPAAASSLSLYVAPSIRTVQTPGQYRPVLCVYCTPVQCNVCTVHLCTINIHETSCIFLATLLIIISGSHKLSKLTNEVIFVTGGG